MSILRKMKRVRLSSQARRAFQGSSRGFTLIEVLVAMALIGIVAVGILSALSTASTILIITDDRATAESLARSQMEDTKNQPGLMGSGNLTIPDEYEQAGYSAALEAGSLRTGLQKITIRIYRHGEQLVTLVGYKLVL